MSALLVFTLVPLSPAHAQTTTPLPAKDQQLASLLSRVMELQQLLLSLLQIAHAQTAATVTFDNPIPTGSSGSLFTGIFQGIDFGTTGWRWENAYGVDPTRHIYFDSVSGTSRSFTFNPAPQILQSMSVFSPTAGTLTLTDNNGQTKIQSVTTGSMQTVTTGWTQGSNTVTVNFTTGQNLGIDDIVYQGVGGTPPPPDTTAPSIPAGLTATPISSSQINLAWAASTDNVGGTGVAGYRVYRGGTQIATIPGTSYSDTVGLSASTAYSYTVAAYDVAGNASVQSGSMSATTLALSPPPMGSLIANWTFDETSGTTASDASGNNNTGALVNFPASPTWTTGRINNALSFDGSNDYVSLGNMDVTGGAITIATWFRANTFPGSGRLVDKSTGSAEVNHYWMLSTVNNGTGEVLRARIRAGGIVTTYVAPTGVLSTNTWYHGAVTYDGSNIILYLNGTEVGRKDKTGALDTNNTVPAQIGRNTAGTAGNYWSGIIDDTRIYNRALTQSEIQALVNLAPALETTPPSTPAGLTVTVLSSSQINTAWTASTDTGGSGLGGYQLERCQGSGCTNFMQIAAPLGTSYLNNTGVSSEITYRYHVRAVDGAGNLSGYSSIAEGTTPALPPGTGGAPMSGPLATRAVPYTESKCSDPNVFFCEDFEDPGTQPVNSTGGCEGRWNNPAWVVSSQCYTNRGSRIVNPAVPIGGFSLNNNAYQFPMNGGTIDGWLGRNGQGKTYTDYYIRYQFYYSPDVQWPVDLDIKQMLSHPEVFVDPPSANFQNGIFIHQDYHCTGLGNFNDAPLIRYGPAYNTFPLNNEYCPPLAPGLPANNINAPRLERNRWYTVETHFVLGSDNTTGFIEAWLDGNLMYRVNRATCQAPCPPMAYVYWTGYKSTFEPNFDGYVQYDNLVMSTKYIGPPSTGGSTDTTAPSTPASLTATPFSSSQINLSWTASTDTGSGVANYRIERCQGTGCMTFTQIASVSTPALTYSDTSVTGNTTYRYQVRAVDAANNPSGYSPIANATTQAPPVFDFSLTNGGAKSVTPGASVTNTITASLISGTSQPSSFSTSGLPTGATASYTPASCTSTCATTLTIATTGSTPIGTYTITSTALAGSLTRTTTFVLTVATTPTLSVNLTTTPGSGTAPLANVTLTATIAGSATGNSNYTFYCNRTDTGTNITTPNDGKFDNQTQTIYTTTGACTYQNPGTYTAKVIAERGAIVAQAQTVVTVSAPPASTNFSLNDRVQTTANLNVRLTPSTSGTLLGNQSTGVQGTVIGGPTFADSFSWWNIDYDTGADGWSAENFLTKVSGTLTPSSGGGGGGSTPLPTLIPSSGGGGGGGGTSILTPSLSSDTTPPAISSATSSDITPTSVTISWTTNEPATRQIDYGFTSLYGAQTSIDQILTTSHTLILPNLSDNTLYHFRVRSKDQAGNESISIDSTFRTATSTQSDITPPVAISTLSVSNTTQTSATFTWIAPGDDATRGTALSYELRYATSSVITPLTFAQASNATGLPQPLSAGTVQSYTLVGLNPGTVYFVAIVAKDEAGNTSPINTLLFTTSPTSMSSLAKVTLTSPNTSACYVQGTPLSITWTKENTDHVALYVTTDGGVTLPQFGSWFYMQPAGTASTSYTWTIPTATTSDLVRIWVESHDASHTKRFALDATNQNISFRPSCSSVFAPLLSPLSLSAPATDTGNGGYYGPSDVIPPPQVANLTAQGAQGQILLSWKNPDSSDWLRTVVIRKEGSQPASIADGTLIYQGTGSEFTDTNLDNAKIYYYAIATLDATPNYSPVSALTARPEAGRFFTGAAGGGSAASISRIPTSPIATSTTPSVPGTTPIPPPASSISGILLTRMLFMGIRHPEVKILQAFLIQQGFLAKGNDTGRFGVRTRAAVQQFQIRYAIASSKSFGYGYVGPATRRKIKEVSEGRRR